MASRIVDIVAAASVVILLVAVGTAWTLNVEADYPFDREYELGPYFVEDGQTMTVDLYPTIEEKAAYGSAVTVEFDASSLPAWITIEGGDADGIVMTIAPEAPASVDCVITAEVSDTIRDTVGTHTIGFTVNALSSNGVYDSVVAFDAGQGISDYDSVSYVAGSAVALPDCRATGMIFQGWYDEDGQKVGNAGDVIVPTDGQVVTAQYVEDPDYVAPGTYDWAITAAIAATVFAIFALCWKYGGAGGN